jgi:uncharacterized protein (TIGR00369 family)
MTMARKPGREDHYRKLERMYLAAPTNAYYRPSIHISEGEARIEIPVRPDLFHAAGAVHGSAYFKVLDDAAFFAANSLVDDVFVLTTSFTLYLTRPISEGSLVGTGRVIQAGKRLMVVEAGAVDSGGAQIAYGSGTFMLSRIALTPEIGYV